MASADSCLHTTQIALRDPANESAGDQEPEKERLRELQQEYVPLTRFNFVILPPAIEEQRSDDDLLALSVILCFF